MYETSWQSFENKKSTIFDEGSGAKLNTLSSINSCKIQLRRRRCRLRRCRGLMWSDFCTVLLYLFVGKHHTFCRENLVHQNWRFPTSSRASWVSWVYPYVIKAYSKLGFLKESLNIQSPRELFWARFTQDVRKKNSMQFSDDALGDKKYGQLDKWTSSLARVPIMDSLQLHIHRRKERERERERESQRGVNIDMKRLRLRLWRGWSLLFLRDRLTCPLKYELLRICLIK